MTTIKALAPWFGNKRTLAPRIVEALGPHAMYVEPFVGGCSVLFAKPRSRSELINDLHGDLINLARVVQDETWGLELDRRLRFTPCHEDALREAADVMRTAEHDPVARAWAYLVVSWQARNGFGGTAAEQRPEFGVRWDAGGGDHGKRWRSVLRSIAHWRRRLMGVTITNRDAFEILASVKDDASTAVYVDPPYVGAGALYTHTFDEVGFFGEPSDHERLRSALDFAEARVVVSYYDVPLVRELYAPSDGWRWIDCSMTKATSHTSGEAATAPEVLIVRGGQA